jgi:hypothetical protein
MEKSRIPRGLLEVTVEGTRPLGIICTRWEDEIRMDMERRGSV